MSRYILLHGAMFRAKDKAPFQQSGFSILGALEYGPQSDMVRCHECGEWFNGLFQHVTADHGISVRQYRADHGLCSGTAICGMRYSRACSRRVKNNGIRNRMRVSAREMGQRSARKQKAGAYRNEGRTEETLNLRRRCAAQLVERISELAEELKRTPSYREMRAAGIPTKSLIELHGSVAEAMKKAGREPRRTHFVAAA